MASVWSLSAELAYDNLPLVHVGVVSDAGGQRFTAGTQADLDVATSLPELNAFLTSIGYGASFCCLAALLGMLNSCATGVTVVNIDNGIGAGIAASLIAKSISKIEK